MSWASLKPRVKALVVGLLGGLYGLTASVASGAINAVIQGTLIVRQSGSSAVAGTDELHVSHNGTNTVLETKSGGVLIDNQDASGYGVLGLNGIDTNYVFNVQAIGSNQQTMRLANNDQAYQVALGTSPNRLRLRNPAAGSAVAFENISAGFFLSSSDGSVGSATSLHTLPVKKTGIADNTATDVITVTVPNGNHAGTIRLTFLSSNGSTDAFESSRTATGLVVLARTTGANVVATAVALADAGIATVSGGETHTLAYDLSSISGAVGATNTFTIRVTIDDSGNLGSNQVVVLAELINAEASGVTMAAA